MEQKSHLGSRYIFLIVYLSFLMLLKLYPILSGLIYWNNIIPFFFEIIAFICGIFAIRCFLKENNKSIFFIIPFFILPLIGEHYLALTGTGGVVFDSMDVLPIIYFLKLSALTIFAIIILTDKKANYK